ncbi:N/A [soil metagenome]
MSPRAAGRAVPGPLDLLAAARAIVSPSINDPRLFYSSLGHQDALERLRYSAIPGSLTVVSGEEGIGKSLLLAVLLDTLSTTIAPVVVNDPDQVRPDTRFLRSLVELAGGTTRGRTGLELTSEFMDRVRAIQGQGRMVSILVDDAHRLSSSQLEILRALLSSASMAQPVNVVVFGEPELLDKIGRKRRLAERVTMHHSLNPLNPDDALASLNHRLNEAGTDAAALFTTAALAALYTRSSGNPGAMFVLAEQMLSAAIEANLDKIDAPLLREIGGGNAGNIPQVRLPLSEEIVTGDAQPAGS